MKNILKRGVTVAIFSLAGIAGAVQAADTPGYVRVASNLLSMYGNFKVRFVPEAGQESSTISAQILGHINPTNPPVSIRARDGATGRSFYCRLDQSHSGNSIYDYRTIAAALEDGAHFGARRQAGSNRCSDFSISKISYMQKTGSAVPAGTGEHSEGYVRVTNTRMTGTFNTSMSPRAGHEGSSMMGTWNPQGRAVWFHGYDAKYGRAFQCKIESNAPNSLYWLSKDQLLELRNGSHLTVEKNATTNACTKVVILQYSRFQS